MAKGIRLTGIKRVRKPDGRVYVYRRVRGQLVPLPNLPENHADFLRAYIEAGEATPKDNSLGAVIGMFLASADFKTRKSSTQSVWRRRLSHMQLAYGTAPVAALTTQHVEKALAKLSPGAARSERTIWRALMAYAKAEHWRPDNPAKDAEIRRAKTRPHAAWTAEDVVRFRARWPIGSPERQAFEVLFWTGARCVDAAHIGWQNVRGGILAFEQEKTGGEACVPVAEPVDEFLRTDLSQFLEAAGSEMLFITTKGGKARSVKALSQLLSAAAREAELPGKTAHGLRKARAVILAENGWTPHRIGAWTGHESLQEITDYTRAVNKRAMVSGNWVGNSGGTVDFLRRKTDT
ncbi:site-specific integrase [Mameliella sp.]|uniref:site-specific integrase n=1 Tax=Mameliella sp. TaxID=1924940 RepID=UPI003BAA7AB2